MKIYTEKVVQMTRAREWWEYKLPPILSAGYIVVYNSGHTFIEYTVPLLMVLLSLIAGAAYVSVLNDTTDLQQDLAAGKLNRMNKYTRSRRWFIVSVSLITGGAFILYYAQNLLSLFCYLSCYTSFTLYSLPPFRFKEKKIAGVLADALGSQMFPTLLITVFLNAKIEHSVQPFLVITIGIWSLCLGLRGILWHQFKDAQSDKISGLQTVAHIISQQDKNRLGIAIISAELFAFVMLLLILKFTTLIVVLILYFCYVYLFCRQSAIPVTIISFVKPSYILMNEFYQVVLPVTILVCAGFNQFSAFGFLLFHILLFPSNLLRVVSRVYSLKTIAVLD